MTAAERMCKRCAVAFVTRADLYPDITYLPGVSTTGKVHLVNKRFDRIWTDRQHGQLRAALCGAYHDINR